MTDDKQKSADDRIIKTLFRKIKSAQADIQDVINWAVKRGEIDTATALIRILDELKS